MIKDLRKTNEKPLQTTIISEKQAKVLPPMENVKTLSGDSVTLPDHLLRRNKSNDPNAQSTLLAISFRDFGFQQLPSWTDPFAQEFAHNDRVDVFKLIVSEGWFTRYILRMAVQASVKANTAASDYDRTMLHFSSDSIAFRDPLRMHNLLSGYVFLLDGLGRVRFAGSGQASAKDVEQLIQLTHELTPSHEKSAPRNPAKKRRQG
jgi:mitochondrial ATPase complex subunit ATP10